jgi:hypothetical protein
MTRPTFDDKDQQLKTERAARYDARPGPRVGDWVVFSEDDRRRITHNWGDSLQTSIKGWQCSDGYHLDRAGLVSYSGGLAPSIDLSRFVDTGETADGTFWFFHHDHAKAHNAVYFKIPCRVFKITP